MKQWILVLVVAVSGCTTLSRTETPSPAPARGGYYKDDGPGANPPADLAAIPDAVPKPEPLRRFANRPYQALGREYVPMTSLAPFRQSGIGSWYGRRYHGQKTSSGEPYDMYAMTAAHPTLPIPSYARVTNLVNGRSVVVRVNDRGPFHGDRIIDLSYTAAWKLGYADAGSARLEVESLLPDQPAPAAVAAAPAAAPPTAPEPRAEAKGVYLQLGAFSSPQGAESFRDRLGRELGWLADAIRIVPGGALYRLQVGPYRSQDDARPVAERIFAELSLRPLIVSR